jgi:propanol-preferring alcohol dehydrogenase
MKAMVVRTPRVPLAAEEREVPKPARGELRIRVYACGVRRSPA